MGPIELGFVSEEVLSEWVLAQRWFGSKARGVGQVTRHRWGREGEYTLCVRMRTAGAAAALFQRLRPLLPPKPHGPITLSLADGRIVRAPRR